jgi:hypothetical protein
MIAHLRRHRMIAKQEYLDRMTRLQQQVAAHGAVDIQ